MPHHFHHQQQQQLMSSINQWYSALQQQMMALQYTNEQLTQRLRGQGDSAQRHPSSGMQPAVERDGLFSPYSMPQAFPTPPPWTYPAPPLLSPFSHVSGVPFNFNTNPVFPDNFPQVNNDDSSAAANAGKNENWNASSSLSSHEVFQNTDNSGDQPPNIRVKREFTTVSSPQREVSIMRRASPLVQDTQLHSSTARTSLVGQQTSAGGGAIPKLNLRELQHAKPHKR